MPFDEPKDGSWEEPCPTMMMMGSRVATSSAVTPTPRVGVTHRDAQDPEAKVRTYLRLLVEVPVRASDRLDPAETAFIEVAAGWSARSGVDRRTLADLGVPREVLDAAGIVGTPVADLVRRQYGTAPFTAADLVRRSGASLASVRTVLAEDEKGGRVTRVPSEGRAFRYRLR